MSGSKRPPPRRPSSKPARPAPRPSQGTTHEAITEWSAPLRAMMPTIPPPAVGPESLAPAEMFDVVGTIDLDSAVDTNEELERLKATCRVLVRSTEPVVIASAMNMIRSLVDPPGKGRGR